MKFENYILSVKPGFHSNAIACVGKQPIMVAAASTERILLAGACVCCVKFSGWPRFRAGRFRASQFSAAGVAGVAK